MEENIREKTMLAAKYIANPKYYLVIIRRISAEITEHVKVTTDKFGEVYLNLFLVHQILENNDSFAQQRFDNVYKLYIYLINKIVRALLLIKKIDEDYWMEFDEILGKIDDKVHENRYLEKLFINNGIDFNWLQSENLPENLDLIIKNIKSQGFLR